MKVPFLDLSRQTRALGGELRAALDEVLESGRFVLQDRVTAFEEAFASHCGADHCVGVASGTDAISLALRAVGVGSGDEVITSAFTCPPTVAGIIRTGARPVLVDVDPVTLTLDPARLTPALSERTRAIVPVHLYGQCADMDPILAVARSRDLLVVEDAAQAHGAEYRSRRTGTLADAAAFSFYPTKNLGALGDGGAVVTNDPALAGRVHVLRMGGVDADQEAIEVASHSRLDELQAAVLRVKLAHLEEWTERRRGIARAYAERLVDLELELPHEADQRRHVFHLFAVRTGRRDELRAALASQGVGTAVHYPLAIHQNSAFADLGSGAELPHAERAASEVLSLPLYPELSEGELDVVSAAVRDEVPASSAA